MGSASAKLALPKSMGLLYRLNDFTREGAGFVKEPLGKSGGRREERRRSVGTEDRGGPQKARVWVLIAASVECVTRGGVEG